MTAIWSSVPLMKQYILCISMYQMEILHLYEYIGITYDLIIDVLLLLQIKPGF
jgi:hypothetical protein